MCYGRGGSFKEVITVLMPDTGAGKIISAHVCARGVRDHWYKFQYLSIIITCISCYENVYFNSNFIILKNIYI